MAQSIYGQTSGTDRKGVTFITQAGNTEATAASTVLSGVRVAALALETAVSTSLLASNRGLATGSIAAGWMSGSVATTLSSSYAAQTASIF